MRVLFEIKIEMPQLDKLTYFSQFFWLCLLLFTFYILFFNNNNGILGISRILKLRNQLLSHRGNKIRSKDPKNLEDISRKGFSTGLSYMYSSLSEVSQWCKTVDYLGKITQISDFGEISGSRGTERQIPHLIPKSSYNTSSSWITCWSWKNRMLAYVTQGLKGDETNETETKMDPDASLKESAKQRPPFPGRPLGTLSISSFATDSSGGSRPPNSHSFMKNTRRRRTFFFFLGIGLLLLVAWWLFPGIIPVKELLCEVSYEHFTVLFSELAEALAQYFAFLFGETVWGGHSALLGIGKGSPSCSGGETNLKEQTCLHMEVNDDLYGALSPIQQIPSPHLPGEDERRQDGLGPTPPTASSSHQTGEKRKAITEEEGNPSSSSEVKRRRIDTQLMHQQLLDAARRHDETKELNNYIRSIENISPNDLDGEYKKLELFIFEKKKDFLYICQRYLKAEQIPMLGESYADYFRRNKEDPNPEYAKLRYLFKFFLETQNQEYNLPNLKRLEMDFRNPDWVESFFKPFLEWLGQIRRR